MPEKKTKLKLDLKKLALLLSYFDYIFVLLRQKARLRPELSPKFLSTLGPNLARTRPKNPARLTICAGRILLAGGLAPSLINIQCLFQTHIVHIQALYIHTKKIKKHCTAGAVLFLNGATYIIFYSFTTKMPQ